MSTTTVVTPTPRLSFGHARGDITPPVGVYHGMWGAARHDRATGVHRPLVGDVMAFGPIDGTTPASISYSAGYCDLAANRDYSIKRLL